MFVILAEDDARFRNVLAALLRDEGHTVELVTSDVQLLAHVRVRRPDALVAHARLVTAPVLDALATSDDAETRIVLMSSEHVEVPRGVTFLDKPFSFDQLRDALVPKQCNPSESSYEARVSWCGAPMAASVWAMRSPLRALERVVVASMCRAMSFIDTIPTSLLSRSTTGRRRI